jgi:NADPH-dependent glutamate synthase beta subunit-like oxidoreductase/dihydroorotate dehydrogenase/ferredoxin
MIKFTEKDISMPIAVGGVKFRNPFYVSSGPTTKSPELLAKAEECGWAAASIKLTFDPEPYINPEPRYGYFSDQGYLAFTAEKRLNVEEGLELVREGRKSTKKLVIFANITYVGEKGLPGWLEMARRFEDAGAHIIELNVCCPNMSFNVEVSGQAIEEGPRTGASLGQDARAVAAIVEAVKKSLSTPVFVKTTAEGGGVAQVAKACFEAGADAVGTNSNRLGIPSIDIHNPALSLYHLQDEPSMSCMSGPWLKPLALRDVYEMRRLVGPEPILTATGGIFTYEDVVQFAMAGADLFGMCTATLVKGFELLPELIKNLKAYLSENGCANLRDVRDRLVEGIASATELNIHPGYMRIKEPNLAAPCKFACPHAVPAQGYVRKVAERDFETAFKLITSKNPLQSVCGYICDHPCETECTRALMDEPIMIREIKRFVLEYAERQGWEAEIERGPAREEKMAVIGSGPAGISCAWDLARAGYQVTMLEAAPEPGGMLRYGIPRFRLPLKILQREIEALKSLGVEIKTNTALGTDFTLEDLKAQGFEAVFLGFGAPKGTRLGISGEDAAGFISATRFLRDYALGNDVPMGEQVAVIGGGFTAVDAARTALRLGAREVFILYRRTRDEMPAVPEEVWEAEEEGVRVMYLVSPKEILTQDGKIIGLRMVNHTLGEYDASERRRPEEVEGTEFTLKVDTVISAIGQEVSFSPSSLKRTPLGTIECDPKTGATNIPWLFVGGDAATGASSVIEAVDSGKRAACTIDKFIAKEEAFLEYLPELKVVDKEKVLLRVKDLERKRRINLEKKSPEKRKTNFQTYTRALTEEEAVAEASRCLGCGCGIGCGLCARICQSFAVNPRDLETFVIDEQKCVACGMCFNLCPNDNIEVVRKE